MLIVAIKLTCTCSSRKIHHKINYVTCTGKMYIKSITFCNLLCVVTDPLPTARKFKPLLWEGAGRSVDIFWTVLHSARNMYRN